MVATMSILGLYQYDPTIFDDFRLPFDGEDREMLLSNLLVELAELEVLYPDAGFIKKAIAAWSFVMCPAWEKMLATEHFEYNPIDNYDRSETVTESESASGSRNGTSSAQGSASGNNDSAVNAFGSSWSSMTPRDEQNSGAESSSNSNFDESDNRTITRTHTKTTSGNIGVTTTQQMIAAEREIVKYRTQWEIIRDFKNRFCILVY